jgi:hypothetical protein
MCTIIISLNNNIINLRKKKGREEGGKSCATKLFFVVCLFVRWLSYIIFINFSRRRRSLHKLFLRSHPVRVFFSFDSVQHYYYYDYYYY